MGWGLPPVLPEVLQFLAGHPRQPQRHVQHADNRLLIGVHHGICNGVRFRPKADFFERNFISDLFGRGNHLPPAFQLPRRFGHGLPGDLFLFADPAHAHQQHPQRMEGTFIHQRAWHHLIVHEMAGQEPVVGVNIGLRANLP